LNSQGTFEKRGTKKKIAFLLVGILLLLVGIIALTGGAAILYFNTKTDSEGYAISDVYQVRSSANAFAVWVAPKQISSTESWLGIDNIAQTKWIVKANDPSQEVFAGWTKATSGEPYLRGIKFESPDQFWHWITGPYRAEIVIPSTAIQNQGTPSRPPVDESFWIKSTTSSATTTLYWDTVWDSDTGMDILILMNADGSSGVNADLQLGFKVPILGWLPYLLVPAGILFCLGGFLVIRRRKKP